MSLGQWFDGWLTRALAVRVVERLLETVPWCWNCGGTHDVTRCPTRVTPKMRVQ